MAIEPASDQVQPDFEAHERDYSGFIKMFKYGAIISLITAAIVILIIT